MHVENARGTKGETASAQLRAPAERDSGRAQGETASEVTPKDKK
jgi:hypothetical protein